MVVLRKLKIELPPDLIPLLGVYPDKNCKSKRHTHIDIHGSAAHDSRDMETTQTPADSRWTKRRHTGTVSTAEPWRGTKGRHCCARTGLEADLEIAILRGASRRERRRAQAFADAWDLKAGHGGSRATDTGTKLEFLGVRGKGQPGRLVLTYALYCI